VVRAGGKQYKVEPNQTFDVERLTADVGSTVDLNVLMLGGNGDVQVGAPLVDGARVVATVIEHGRGRKVIVFKYKNKTRYRRKAGHRQEFTRLTVQEIVTAGGVYTAEAPEKKKPVRKSAKSMAEPEPDVVTAETPVAEAPVEAAAPDAVVEAAPEAEAAPRTARKPATRKSAANAGDKPKPAPRARAAKPKPAAEDKAEEPASDVESTEETE
jgi:large subunit ribosomal protein L21